MSLQRASLQNSGDLAGNPTQSRARNQKSGWPCQSSVSQRHVRRAPQPVQSVCNQGSRTFPTATAHNDRLRSSSLAQAVIDRESCRRERHKSVRRRPCGSKNQVVAQCPVHDPKAEPWRERDKCPKRKIICGPTRESLAELRNVRQSSQDRCRAADANSLSIGMHSP
jgi:hypothetical protein